MRSNRGQAAFEYLFTYGWAILAAIIAIGALSYFGFISPSNLLPNKCSFGKQMECVETLILEKPANTADVKITLRNNFGKPIDIISLQLPDSDDPTDAITSPTGGIYSTPIQVASGNTSEVAFTVDTTMYNSLRKSKGEKAAINVLLTFKRADLAGSAEHNITGYIFNTIS